MYSELYKAWKAEKTTENPQQIADDLYQRTENYLRSLEQDSASGNSQSLQGRLLLKEKETATRLFNELKETRLRKIINGVRNSLEMDAAALSAEEKVLIDNIKQSVQSFNANRRTATEGSGTPEAAPELAVVRFLQDIPEIVGVDLKMYGPFKKEDVASLPAQNAQALIKQGAVKSIEVAGVS
jgi:DNA replication factor GINS